jgi:AbrB family looped-hinge helix DNA binding protein
MNTTTLSPKFQIVIPKHIRDILKLEPGNKFHLIEYDGRIEMVPLRKAKELRGFLRGIRTDVPRENDRL